MDFFGYLLLLQCFLLSSSLIEWGVSSGVRQLCSLSSLLDLSSSFQTAFISHELLGSKFLIISEFFSNCFNDRYFILILHKTYVRSFLKANRSSSCSSRAMPRFVLFNHYGSRTMTGFANFVLDYFKHSRKFFFRLSDVVLLSLLLKQPSAVFFGRHYDFFFLFWFRPHIAIRLSV